MAGQRSEKVALAVTVADKNIHEDHGDCPSRELQQFMEQLVTHAAAGADRKSDLKGDPCQASVSLIDVGLELSEPWHEQLEPCPVARRSGSVWRRRLVPGLVGVAYILDEPSIGLHQRDNDKLLSTLKQSAGSWQYADCG